MAREAFPPKTRKTWIALKLEEGDNGRGEVNRHVMSVYAWPLQVYFKGTSYRGIAEPEDVVQGFFADRLSRQDFLDSWHRSGLRLRRWLMNGFSFYLKELSRELRKEKKRSSLPVEDIQDQKRPEEALDRAFARAVVKVAMEQTEELCRAEGLGEHWKVFRRHFYDGEAYGSFVKELGITTTRAAVMARTAVLRFKRALRDLLGRDGATEEEIDDEIRSLLEVSG